MLTAVNTSNAILLLRHENVPVWSGFVDAESHGLFFALTC